VPRRCCGETARMRMSTSTSSPSEPHAQLRATVTAAFQQAHLVLFQSCPLESSLCAARAAARSSWQRAQPLRTSKRPTGCAPHLRHATPSPGPYDVKQRV